MQEYEIAVLLEFRVDAENKEAAKEFALRAVEIPGVRVAMIAVREPEKLQPVISNN